MKKTFYKEVAFIGAMFTNSLALSLLAKSSFGVSTLSSLPLVLNEVIPDISFGVTNFLVQTVLLIILIILTRQPKIAYIMSFFVGVIYGFMVDMFEIAVAYLSDGIIFRIGYFFIGWALISFGAALFIKSTMPLMPFDAFVRDASAYYKKKVRVIKTILDLVFVITSIALALSLKGQLVGVGIGTIFMALFTGNLVQLFLDLLSRFDFKCQSKIGEKLSGLATIKES